MQKKIIRMTTIPIALEKLLTGQLTFMNSFYDVIAVSSEKENLDKFGVENNIKTFHVEMTRKITPFKDLLAIFKLYFFLKREQPFIVHTHTPKAGMVGMIASKMAGVPHRLHTVAGLPLLEIGGLKRKVLNVVEKVTYACATKIYPNSKGLHEIIINNKFCEPIKLKVIGSGSSNGIDTSFFDPKLFSEEKKNTLKKELGIGENDYVFVFVGRLVKDKGINELVAAFDEISQKMQNLKLLLVGYLEDDLDPLQDVTLSIIKSNKGIIETGFQSDVRPFFAVSNALVFPSYREGFPNVVMQAAAMNLPCIVSDINGCNEIISNENNGLVIPVKSREAIKRAMLRFVEDPFLNDEKDFFRNNITKNYEQTIIWQEILAEYRVLDV